MTRRPSPAEPEAPASTEAEGLRAIFSVLAPGEAEVARRETLARQGAALAPDAGALLWLRATAGGRPLAAGTVHPLSGTRLIEPGGDHPLLAALRAFARSAAPGEMAPADPGDWLLWRLTEGEGAGETLCLAVPGAALVAALDATGASVTPAEARLLFQLLAGRTLAEAAARDGVSPETRRAQLKSLMGKLGCKRQAELVRLATGLLMAAPLALARDRTGAATVEAFVGRHLPAARLGLLRLADGRQMRWLEAGPAAGRPLLLFHGMLLPLPLLAAAPVLNRLDLRVLMPVRRGYLDDTPTSRLASDSAWVEEDLDAIAALLAALGIRPQLVLGHSYGALAAIRFAARHPTLTPGLLLASLNAGSLHGPEGGIADRFFAGFRALMHRPGLFRMIGWQFRKYYADRAQVAPILRPLFAACPDDCALLDGVTTGVPAWGWFSDCYRTSVVGIAEDFRLALGDWRACLEGLAMPVRIVHGKHDPLVPFEALARAVAPRPVVPLDAGHLALATCPEAVWTQATHALHPPNG